MLVDAACDRLYGENLFRFGTALRLLRRYQAAPANVAAAALLQLVASGGNSDSDQDQ